MAARHSDLTPRVQDTGGPLSYDERLPECVDDGYTCDLPCQLDDAPAHDCHNAVVGAVNVGASQLRDRSIALGNRPPVQEKGAGHTSVALYVGDVLGI